MKYNLFGETGLLVSELCLGTMTFGGEGMWKAIGELQQETINDLMKEAVNAGINFIDTANIYSYGQSEQLLGAAIRDTGINRNELVIATKVRGRMAEGPNNAGLSRYHIFQSVYASLERLQMDYVDILYVHGVDPLTPVEETMRALNDLVNEGKVRYIAVCNWPAWLVMKAQGIARLNGWHTFKGLQYYYSVGGRDIEREIIPMALDQRLAVMPWSPLAGGFLSGKYRRDEEVGANNRRVNFDFPPINKEKAYDIVELMDEIAQAHNATVAQIALAWVRMQRGITSTIIGAKTVSQLKDNLASVSITLTPDELERIHQASMLAPEYPGWMVERQGADRQ